MKELNESIIQKIDNTSKEQPDLAKALENFDDLPLFVTKKVERVYKKIKAKYIPIPQIKITDEGVEDYKFIDFDLDLTEFTQVPVSNELYIQNLIDLSERNEIRGADKLNFDALNPAKVLLDF